MSEAFAVLLVGIVGSDLLLAHLIGSCPALAMSRKLGTAFGLGLAIVVIVPHAFLLARGMLALLPVGINITSALPAIAMAVLLAIYAGGYLAYLLTPRVYIDVEPFIPLLAVNCVLLGLVLLGLEFDGPLLEQFLYAIGLAAGYAVFLVAFAEIRERLAFADVPGPFREAPVAVLTMAILALAFFGLGV